MTQETALKIDGLTVNYDKTPVLWDIHLEIPSGMLVGIIGPNGAGKSTLLKASLGLLKPLAGKISFFGEPFKTVRDRIAYVPQRSSVDWDFPITVLDVVLMGRYGKLGFFKRPKAADFESAKEVLEWVGLAPFAHRQISQLSGGQQQRLFIARALLQDADLYLMDEPFAGIDAATEKELVALLEKLKSRGKTLILVHHEFSSVTRYFDWVVLLNTCLIASGPAAEVFNTENVMRTYQKGSHLFDKAVKLAQSQSTGMI